METLTVTLLSLLSHIIVAFPTGPPTKVCYSMAPNEGHGKSHVGTKTIPFQLLVTNLTYSPGQHIKGNEDLLQSVNSYMSQGLRHLFLRF